MRASAVHKAWRDRGRVRLSSELHIAAVVSNSASRSSSIGINRRRRSGGGLKIFSPNERDVVRSIFKPLEKPKTQKPKSQKPKSMWAGLIVILPPFSCSPSFSPHFIIIIIITVNLL